MRDGRLCSLCRRTPSPSRRVDRNALPLAPRHRGLAPLLLTILNPASPQPKERGPACPAGGLRLFDVRLPPRGLPDTRGRARALAHAGLAPGGVLVTVTRPSGRSADVWPGRGLVAATRTCGRCEDL